MADFIKLLVCALVLISSSNSRAESVQFIHAGSIIVEAGKPLLKNHTVVVDDKRIVALAPGFLNALDGYVASQIIDLKSHYLLPGLMDMHVHLLDQLGPSSRTDALFTTTSMLAIRGVHYANKTLLAGFTTVRDLGADPEAIYALRDAINQGLISGPRIFAAGSAVAATGGHGDVDGIKPELLKLWTPETICDGPYECRKAVRNAIKMGADWIKITATGGVLSDTKTGTDQQMTDGELTEIVQTAHGLGVKVAAHAHGANGIKAALQAGVDSIDHGSFTDSEAIKLFKQQGAYLVPTLSPSVKVPAMMEGNPFFTPAIKAKALAASEASQKNFLAAYRAGIKIAFGTDSAVTPHGENADEFLMMVEAGMSEVDAIKSATITSAELIGMEDKLGTIEVGKLADIIAVRVNPLQDISALQDIDFIMKEGQLVKSTK